MKGKVIGIDYSRTSTFPFDIGDEVQIIGDIGDIYLVKSILKQYNSESNIFINTSINKKYIKIMEDI